MGQAVIVGLLKIPFDTTPLTAWLNRRDVRAYATVAKRTVPREVLPGAGWRHVLPAGSALIASSLGIVLGVVMMDDEPNWALGGLVALAILGIPGGIALGVWVLRHRVRATSWSARCGWRLVPARTARSR